MATLLKFIMDKCIELYLGSKPDQEDFNEDKKTKPKFLFRFNVIIIICTP